MALIRTIWTSKKDGYAENWLGRSGEIFYDPTTGTLRLSNGVTPGGILNGGGGTGGGSPGARG